jgi:hypothetical protein
MFKTPFVVKHETKVGAKEVTLLADLSSPEAVNFHSSAIQSGDLKKFCFDGR